MTLQTVSGLPWRLFALDAPRLWPLERALLRIALLIALGVVGMTWLDMQTCAGIDLRNRVVGARVMLAGYDPYSFTWQAGMPEEWLDPVHDAKVHRLTAPPPALWLYAPLAPLPYRAQRCVSFVVEWLALALSLALLARTLPSQRLRVVFLLGALLFVVASDFWRLHLERGQMYVLVLVPLSLAAYLGVRRGLDSVSLGLALAAAALLRPNLLLAAPALFVLGRWRSGTAALCGFGAIALTTAALMHPDSWASYVRVGQQYYRTIDAPEALPDRPPPDHVGPVEGVDFTRALPNVETSSFAVLYRTLSERVRLPDLDLARTSKALLALLAGGLLYALWPRRRDSAPRDALALIISFALAGELFLPHRWSYVDVVLLAPLALLLPALLRDRHALGLVLVGLLAGQVGQHVLPLYVATVLRAWLVLGGLAALALTQWLRGACDAGEAQPARSAFHSGATAVPRTRHESAPTTALPEQSQMLPARSRMKRAGSVSDGT